MGQTAEVETSAPEGYSAKLQQHKLDAISALKTLLGEGRDMIFADYRGLSVEQITALRRKLKDKGAALRVIKNRHAKIALGELEFPDVSEYLVGPTALALTEADSGAVAKILFDYGADTAVRVKGAIIDGKVFGDSEVEEYSKLPSRADLLSKLMSAMNGPITNLLYAMRGVPEQLVRTLQAVADRKGTE